MASGSAQPRRVEVELYETPVDALSDLPHFPMVAIAFCCARLIRPVLLQATYSGGPQEKDGVASFANALVWMAAVCGILGAIAVSSPLREWLKIQGASPSMTWKLEPVALAFLASAVLLDVFHQIFAFASLDYFWGTGMVEESSNGDDMLPFFLIILHCIGFLGLLGTVAAYARCFRGSWRKFTTGPPRGYADDHRPAREGRIIRWILAWYAWLQEPSQGDIEEGGQQAGKATATANSFDPDAVPTPARAKPDAQQRQNGPRAAGAAARPPPMPSQPPEPNEEGGHWQVPRRSSGSSRVEPEPRASVGTPPRAWLWNGSEWVPVRIMRTAPDGGTFVRLVGGNVVTTDQRLLRPRTDSEDPPPSQPPPQQRWQRPSSAGRSRPASNGERRRPSWSPNPVPPATGAPSDASKGSAGRPCRPSSAPPSGRAESSPSMPVREEAEGVAWAAERMGRLRKELQLLDRKSHAERRFALRQLQRELHPDKQPAEMRAHAQPLFMMVQKEWEVAEACAKAASEKT